MMLFWPGFPSNIFTHRIIEIALVLNTE